MSEWVSLSSWHLAILSCQYQRIIYLQKEIIWKCFLYTKQLDMHCLNLYWNATFLAWNGCITWQLTPHYQGLKKTFSYSYNYSLITKQFDYSSFGCSGLDYNGWHVVSNVNQFMAFTSLFSPFLGLFLQELLFGWLAQGPCNTTDLKKNQYMFKKITVSFVPDQTKHLCPFSL